MTVPERTAPLVPSRTQSNVVGRSALSALAAVSLEETIEAIDGANTRDEATAALMKHVGVRFESSLLFTIKEGAALGFRGHGAGLTAEAVTAVTIPLSVPSLVKAAFSAKATATSAPPGAIQGRLLKLLGDPSRPRSTPIVVGGRVACVLVVGDATGDPHQAATELDRLAEAISLTYTRIVRESKPKR